MDYLKNKFSREVEEIPDNCEEGGFKDSNLI